MRALQELARGDQGADLKPLLDADIDLDPTAAFDLIDEALQDAASPVYIVIDDAHRAREHLGDGLLGMLIEHGCDSLRTVVIGTSYVEAALSRRALMYPRQVIRAKDLAFDIAEIEALSTGAPADLPAQHILEETKGWPIAVRLMQLTGIRPHANSAAGPLMKGYFKASVLATMPAELAEFALTTSVCGENPMSPEMAAAISGRQDSAELLELCLYRGLFIDRYDTPAGAVYRWHRLFARACQALLEEGTAGGAKRAYEAAARFSVDDAKPFLAAYYWMKAGDIPAAIDVVLTHWVSLLVGQDSQALDRWCVGLPSPYDEDPCILLVRACVQEVNGARDVAMMLRERAEARAEESTPAPRYEAVRAQAMLLLIDDRMELARATEVLREQLNSAEPMSPHARAATLYLLGFAELRHRRSPALVAQLLSAAATEAEALGDLALAGRSLSHLAFSLAWVGQFRHARKVLARCQEFMDDEVWLAYAGEAVAVTAGYLAYWADDHERVLTEFRRGIRRGHSPFTFAGVARMMLAFAAADSRDPAACRRAARELQEIPSEDRLGVSWSAFRNVSLAVLHEAAGRRDRAMKVVARYEEATDLPLMTVVLAGIAIRAGQVRLAHQTLSRLGPYAGISYVRVSTLATEALLRARAGHPQWAHELLEQALAAAAEEDVRLPFSSYGLEMRTLLSEHLAWGTLHEEFVVLCLSPRTTGGPLDALSERERAIFEQLRTTKTMQEIGDALGVSINTVKTHQRSIYRKLGVSTRREAVRLFA